MSPPREEKLFKLALEKSVDERPEFLDAVCGDDSDVRRRVEALLAAHDSETGFLPDEQSTESAATLLDESTFTEGSGTQIDRYKLLEKLGEGGFGSVWAAEQKEPVRRRVALKIIKLGMDTKQVVARFEAERQALALMDHPNIAKVLDAGSTDTGRPYFVMELVKGMAVTKYCQQEKLDTNARLNLFIKICQAIQHAHQKGIIHRDIKPSNVMITLHDGVPVPKVIDFGIAKATQQELTEKTIYTQYSQFIGTPAYMSPEQAEMSGLDIDTRSDIYSLGVLLYELLTGSTPFDSKELMMSGLDEMRKIIREKEPVRPSTRLSQTLAIYNSAAASSQSAPRHPSSAIETDLDWIVMKCLEKDRARRYESANGLASDLKRHLNHEPVTACPPTAAYRFQKAWQRNKLVYSAVALVVVALVAGLSLAAGGLKRAVSAKTGETEQRQVAEQKATEARASEEKAIEASQRAEASKQQAIENQQRSRRLLYASDMNLADRSLKEDNLGRAVRLLERHRPKSGEEDLRGWEWRYLWQWTQGSLHTTLTNRPVRGWDISLSPDGSRLAVSWEDGQVDLWDVAAQRLIRSLTDRREDRYNAHVAFSPAQNLLAATSETGVVTLYDLDSGRESEFWRAPDSSQWRVRRLAFSKDGSKLVIFALSSSPNVNDEVYVVDMSSKTESRHSTGFKISTAHTGGAQLSPDGQRLYLARIDQQNDRYCIQCLDLVTGDEEWSTVWLTDNHGLTALVLSPDGGTLASASGFSDSTIRVWDAETGLLLHELDGHSRWVCDLEFSRDGGHLISAATDQTIRFWDTSAWAETRVLRGHRDEVHAVAISETAQIVASVAKDGDLMVWRVEENNAGNGYIRLPETLNPSQVKLMDHSQVLLLPPNQSPELLDLKSNSAAAPLPDLGPSANVLDYFGGHILCRWDEGNQILVHEWRGDQFVSLGTVTLDSDTRPTGVAYNVTRDLLAWTEATSSNSIYLANLATPGRRIELRNDVPSLIPVAFSEDGNHLLCSARDKSLSRVWNIGTGRIVTAINEPVSEAAFADGGRALVTIGDRTSGQGGHEIVFYNLANPNETPRRVLGKFYSRWLAVSPVGALVASPSHGGEVRLFDAVKGELIETLHGHMGSANAVAFSPDGERLISRATNGELKLWDVGTRQELLTLSGARSDGTRVRWNADGDIVLSGAHQAWRAPSWEEIETAEISER